MTSFVGVDLHRNNFTYCIRENGEEKKIGKCEISELKGFASLLGKDTAMAVEATGNTFMFCRFLKAHVGRLVVVNPSQFKVISTSTKKTDKHDAKILAEFLEKDMLPEVRMKDDLQAKISSLTQTREKLVQLRTVLKNKVNNLLAANFIVLKREELSTETGLRKALSFHFDPITDTELFVVVEQIRSLNQSIEKLDKAIEDHGSKMDGFKNLKSIKGIGSKGAATLLSTIGNIVVIKLTGQRTSVWYPETLRLIEAIVEIDGKPKRMTFITDNFTWAASSICDLYKARWAIEVFFKEIKQTLQLSDFIGYNENAVRWQIWTALLTYILLRFIAWQNEWKHTFTRLFTALRGVIWRCLDMGSVLRCCGTASDSVRMRGAPEQAYLPGFAQL